MGTISRSISVDVSNGMMVVDPNVETIPDVNTGDTVKITWTVTGLAEGEQPVITFNPADVNPPPQPTPGPNNTLSTSYTAPTVPLKWGYTITIVPERTSPTPRPHDPEIDNVNP